MLIILIFLPSIFIITITELQGETMEEYIHSAINNQEISDYNKALILFDHWENIDFEHYQSQYPEDIVIMYGYMYDYGQYSTEDIKHIMEKCETLSAIDPENYAHLLEHLFMDNTETFFHAYINVNPEVRTMNIEWLKYAFRKTNDDFHLAGSHINYYEMNQYERSEWTSLVSSLETNSR